MELTYFRKTVSAFSLLCIGSAANAANINYKATNLPDINVGEDLWEYTYTVSNHLFNTINGFSIFFNPQDYSNLADPAPAVNTDWDIAVFQPDNALPDDGIYDALSLTNGASLADSFTVSFIYTGNASPGIQPYEIFDDTFNIVASGLTTTVPVPTSLLLLASGLMGISGFNKKRITKIKGETP